MPSLLRVAPLALSSCFAGSLSDLHEAYIQWGVVNVMLVVFPRIYKGATSWRNTCTPIVLSMLKVVVVIDHVTLNEVRWSDLL